MFFEKQVHINDLPNETLLNIFKHLDDPSDLAKASEVSKRWRQVSNDNCLWKNFGAKSKQAYMQLANNLNNYIKIVVLGKDKSIGLDVLKLPDKYGQTHKFIIGIDTDFVRVSNWQLAIHDRRDYSLHFRFAVKMYLKETNIALVCLKDDADINNYNELIKENAPNTCTIYVTKDEHQFKELNINSDNVVVFNSNMTKEAFYANIMFKFIKLSQINANPDIQPTVELKR